MDLKRGSSVNLGRYYFNNKNVKTPVSWTIIAEKEDEVLLLSDRILEFRPFNNSPLNDEGNPVNWKTSSLRKWLNETLFNELFDERVRPYIYLRSYTTKPNHIAKRGESINSANDEQEQITEDRITILSWEECMTYLDFDPENKVRQSVYEEMKAHGTTNAIYDVLMAKRGLDTDALPFARSSATTRSPLTKHYSGKGYDNGQSTYFWLRSPGCNPNTFVYSYDGLVNREGKECNEVLGVRPMVWVSKAGLTDVLENKEKYFDDTSKENDSETNRRLETPSNSVSHVNTPEVKKSEYWASKTTYRDPLDIFLGILLILAGFFLIALSIFLIYLQTIANDLQLGFLLAVGVIGAFIGGAVVVAKGMSRFD